MKSFFMISVCVLAFIVQAQTQSAWQIMNSNIDDPSEYQAIEDGIVSPANAWAGSDIKYQSGGGVDGILLNARLLLELADLGNFHIPIMSNIELSFEQPISEFAAGIFPWSRLSNSFVAHGGIELQADGMLENRRFRLFAGAEFAYPSKTTLPLTVSVAPVVLIGQEETVFGIDGVVIIPIANGLGLLAQVEKRFNNVPTMFAFGIAANTVL